MKTEKGFFAKIADTISSELEYNRRTAEELGVERLDLFLYGTKGAVKRKTTEANHRSAGCAGGFVWWGTVGMW